MRFLIFFSIMLAVLVGIHYLLWARLIRDIRLPGLWFRVLSVLLWLLPLAMMASFWLRRAWRGEPARYFAVGMYAWLGLAIILFLFVCAGDLTRLFLRLKSALLETAPVDEQRRLFFARVLAGAAGFGGLMTSAWAAREAVSNLRVKEIELALSRFPKSLDGFRLVQISDLHIGPTLRRAWLQSVVDRVNARQPDLIAITGDLVDGSVEALASEVEPLKQLRAKHGVFFVTGNHDYYSGVEPWLVHVRSLGITVLRNERVSIGGNAASFDLAGIDDHSGPRGMPGHGPDLERAVQKRDSQRELVLLAHQPRAADEARRYGVGLLLCGHTHGGQIWPFRHFVYLQQPFVSGLNRTGETWVYVNSGTGFWGPPMRLGTSSEITEFRLRRA